MVMLTRRACAALRMQQLPNIKQEMGKISKKNPHSSPPASPTATGQCPGSPSERKRRASRPVDRRLKMRDWLVMMLNAGELQDVLWWTQKNKLFAVKWTHAARHGFRVSDDAKLTKAWALHSGVFQEGDQEDHKKWKSNFRCALHSLPDVKEVGPTEKRRGQNAHRLYELLEKPEVRKRKDATGRRVRNRFVIKKEEKDGSDSDSGQSTATEPSNASATPPHVPAPTDYCIPDFSKLGLNTQGMTSSLVQTNHLSGGLVIKKEPASADRPSTVRGNSSFSMTSASSDFPIPVPTIISKMSTSINYVTSIDTLFQVEEEEKEKEHDEEEEESMMWPVGIMTTRVRTPSGDSGHPNSPSCMDEQILEERIKEEIPELPHDSSIPMKDSVIIIQDENGTFAIEQQDMQDMDWDSMILLSSTCPRAVAVEEVMSPEDFDFSGLSTMDSVL